MARWIGVETTVAAPLSPTPHAAPFYCAAPTFPEVGAFLMRRKPPRIVSTAELHRDQDGAPQSSLQWFNCGGRRGAGWSWPNLKKRLRSRPSSQASNAALPLSLPQHRPKGSRLCRRRSDRGRRPNLKPSSAPLARGCIGSVPKRAECLGG